tara:strand:+ start:840 stop:2159 length:1320 start_codon:yes stop_codon:yes gene_type:complete
VASNFDIRTDTVDRFLDEGDLQISADNGTPIIVKKDGTIVAQGFKDVQDPIQLFIKNGGIYAKIDGPNESIIEYDFKDNLAIYKVPVQSLLQTTNSFDSFEGFTVSCNKNYRQKFTKGFSREERNLINTVTLARKNEFHFTDNVSGVLYSSPLLRTLKYFKPINVPTKLVLDRDFKGCNDLIVIKTGEVRYAPDGVTPSGLNREGIVWVSPHEKFNFTGVTTQVKFVSGLKATASSSYGSGQSGNVNIPVTTGISRISSKLMLIKSGHTLTGGMVCEKFSNANSGSLVAFTGHSDLKDSLFYQTVSGKYTGVAWNKFKSGVYTGAAWDGIIPSGIPVKIEVYSSSDVIGGEFAISQVPTGDINFKATISALTTGIGNSYEQAMQNGYDELEDICRNKFDYAMQLSGWRNENSKFRRFKKLINVSASKGTIQLTGLQRPT